MEKVVEVLRADVVNKNENYYPLEVLKDFAERAAGDKAVIVDKPRDDLYSSSGNDLDFRNVVGVLSDFYIEGESLYATATVFDDFVDDVLKRFQKNKIPVYLSPCIAAERVAGGKVDKIEYIPEIRFTINPAAKWRGPFLND